MILVLSFFPLVFGDAKGDDWKVIGRITELASDWNKMRECFERLIFFFHNWVCCFFSTKCFFYIRIRIYIYIYTYYMYNCIYLSIHILYTEYLICSLSRGIMDWWDAIQLGGLSSQWLQPHNGCSHTTLTRTRIHVLESTSCFQSFGLFANNFHTDSRW